MNYNVQYNFGEAEFESEQDAILAFMIAWDYQFGTENSPSYNEIKFQINSRTDRTFEKFPLSITKLN